jgi:hypothetical protein
MKFREWLNEEKYSDQLYNHLISESWKAGIDQSYSWEGMGMQKRNFNRWLVQQKGFDKAFKELKSKKDITTGMLKPLGITMNSFLKWGTTDKEIRDYVAKKMIEMYEKALKEVKDSYPYQLLKKAKIPWNKDLGYVMQKVKMPKLNPKEEEKLKEFLEKKKKGIESKILWHGY